MFQEVIKGHKVFHCSNGTLFLYYKSSDRKRAEIYPRDLGYLVNVINCGKVKEQKFFFNDNDSKGAKKKAFNYAVKCANLIGY